MSAITPTAPSGAGSNRDRPDSFFRSLSRRPAFKISAALGILLLVTIVVTPMIIGVESFAVDPANRLQPPSPQHWFGTDDYGRDLLSRVSQGFLVSCGLGAVVAASSAIVGTIIGILAGYFRVLDGVLMRLADGLMAFPGILLAMALVAALGPSVVNLMIALVIVLSPAIARLVRSRVLSVKEELYIEAIRGQGATPLRVLVRHILPNTINILFVQVAFVFADAIMVEAALSFLGAGVGQPTPSLGNILYDGKQVFLTSPAMVVFPSLVLVLTVMAVNLMGDAAREVVDPRASRRIWRRRDRVAWHKRQIGASHA